MKGSQPGAYVEKRRGNHAYRMPFTTEQRNKRQEGWLWFLKLALAAVELIKELIDAV